MYQNIVGAAKENIFFVCYIVVYAYICITGFILLLLEYQESFCFTSLALTFQLLNYFRGPYTKPRSLRIPSSLDTQ